MYRDDFPILNNEIIYFDNGATTLKPKSVIESINDYLCNYSANAHRGDYDISQKVDSLYEETRDIVKEFINAKQREEIIFTSGATDSINRVVFGFMKDYLKKDDVVLISKTEHASNTLPWFELEKQIGIKVKYISLDNYFINLDNVKNAIDDQVKVISLAHVTNTIGDTRPMKEIIKIAHEHNILVLCDGCQSVPHMKVDVQDLDVDFLAFSAHKMLGSTGTGVLYGKYDLLNQMKPLIYGGGMNAIFDSNKKVEYKELPLRLEAGTQNIVGVLSLRKAIKYLNKVGIDNIHKYELELRDYLISKMENINDVIIYNKHIKSNVVLFNIKGIFPEDFSRYLNYYHICVRAGNHCAKMVKEEIGTNNTLRISLYFYNTKEEIDRFIEILNKKDEIFKVIL